MQTQDEVRVCSLRTRKRFLFELVERRGCCGIYSIDDEERQWLHSCVACPSEGVVDAFIERHVARLEGRGVYVQHEN